MEMYTYWYVCKKPDLSPFKFWAMISRYYALKCTTEQIQIIFVARRCASGAQLRLRGLNSLQGRVEVCQNSSVWGTVCNDGWDVRDAQVACRQLGFQASGIKLYINDIAFG